MGDLSPLHNGGFLAYICDRVNSLTHASKNKPFLHQAGHVGGEFLPQGLTEWVAHQAVDEKVDAGIESDQEVRCVISHVVKKGKATLYLLQIKKNSPNSFAHI